MDKKTEKEKSLFIKGNIKYIDEIIKEVKKNVGRNKIWKIDINPDYKYILKEDAINLIEEINKKEIVEIGEWFKAFINFFNITKDDLK